MTSPQKHKDWLKSLPYSRPLPDTLGEHLKYNLWRMITPFHPYFRDLLVYMRLLRHEGRDNFLLGKLAPNKSMEDFVAYLLEKGFGNHFIAWHEDGQVVSLRYTPDFKYQYHIRVFEDGEVRGHYEFTPEYRPFLHMKEIGMEPRFEYFSKILGEHIIPA